MLKNEVGNDGAAPAMENQTRNENLINEFSSALSESTALQVAAGTAVIAAGALATVAAIKYAKPALEAGKALSGVTDESALAAVRAAANNGEILPSTVRKFDHGKAISGVNAYLDEARLLPKALPKPGETGVLAVERNGRIDTAAIDALMEGSIPISAATRDAAAKALAPATEALVKNSIPITKITKGAEPFPFFGMSDELAARMEYFGVPLKGELPGLDAAAVLRGKPLGHEFVPAYARIDDASILAHEVAHRSGNSSPSVAYLQQLKDIRALDFGGGLFKNGKPMTERLGFKEVDPKLPMFPTMDDLVKLMPESGPNMSKVVMNLDGAPRAVSVSDAVTILGERSVLHIQSNPTAAAKALAERMPKPALESDVTALAAKMTQRLDPATVNEAIAKTTKGV